MQTNPRSYLPSGLCLATLLILHSVAPLWAATIPTDGLPLEYRGKLKRIGIIPVVRSPVVITDLTGVTAGLWSFGGLGLAFTEGARQGAMDRRAALWAEKTKDLPHDLSAELLAQLKQGLEAKGYEVVLLPPTADLIVEQKKTAALVPATPEYLKAKPAEQKSFARESEAKKQLTKWGLVFTPVPSETPVAADGNIDLYLSLETTHGYFRHNKATKQRDEASGRWLPLASIDFAAYRGLGVTNVTLQGQTETFALVDLRQSLVSGTAVNHNPINLLALTSAAQSKESAQNAYDTGARAEHHFTSDEAIMADPKLALEGMRLANARAVGKFLDRFELKPATVYVIRQKSTLITHDWMMYVRTGDRYLPALDDKAAIYTTVQPGEQEIRFYPIFPFADDFVTFKFAAEAGKTHYLSAELDAWGKEKVLVSILSEAEGERLVQKYLPEKKSTPSTGKPKDSKK